MAAFEPSLVEQQVASIRERIVKHLTEDEAKDIEAVIDMICGVFTVRIETAQELEYFPASSEENAE